MRAMVIDEWGGRKAMHEADVEPPPVGPDYVQIRVRAAGVNPVDTKIRAGGLAPLFPAHFPLILGWDAAGTVEQVGPAVTMFRPGDEVYAYCRRHDLQYGTYGELVSVPDAFVAHKPESLDFNEAGALPLVGLTAHQALESVGVRGGEKLFVTGGAGGVGHIAIQLAVARGAQVIATASPANHDWLRELGAEPLDYNDGDVPARVRELTGDGGADAAIDLFGGDGREQAFAVAPQRRPADLDRLAAAREARRRRDPLRVRPAQRRRPARAGRARRRGPPQAAHRGDLPARARRRRARAHRGRPRARQARAQRSLRTSVPIAPSSASVAPSVSTKKPTCGRASAWS